jgi:hypothetical protein
MDHSGSGRSKEEPEIVVLAANKVVKAEFQDCYLIVASTTID